MKIRVLLLAILALSVESTYHVFGQPVTSRTLLHEMVDLKRLAELPDHSYTYVQFSSYDRRSTRVSEQGWFANSDGFGDEPIPGFERVLKAPDKNGIGEYLICEINSPGAILRMWTARMYGSIRLYLDQNDIPVYEGPAQDFFWNPLGMLSPDPLDPELVKRFRQSDATYFPIPFSRSCRIEWVGDITRTHFYHIGIRVYEPTCDVITFSPGDIQKYMPELERVSRIMANPAENWVYDSQVMLPVTREIPKNTTETLVDLNGPGAIEYFSLKVSGADMNTLLRQNIISIYFDGAPVPQVQSPLGDFFGAAPGINPYQSIPFSVYPDGTMECRFIMPFGKSARIDIENRSGEEVRIKGGIRVTGYQWNADKSMHFRARWRISHGLTASATNIVDMPYLMAFGRGRVVGATTFVLNPTDVPGSHGNWWGEGDEKIFVDQDTFPSLFGTGSEDYYNYSWSSSDIFSFPYSGQPRNDGPGNRGFVANYRWHVLDDIPFNNRLAFYMELLHHGEVRDFGYGRTVYLYALPGLLDDHEAISDDHIRKQILPGWNPVAYKGSEGYRFIQAEALFPSGDDYYMEKGELWAGDQVLVWTPDHYGDEIGFLLPDSVSFEKERMIMTLAHGPDGGKISIFLNEELVLFGKDSTISLFEPYHHVSRSHTSGIITINEQRRNQLLIKYLGESAKDRVGIDFIWLRK